MNQSHFNKTTSTAQPNMAERESRNVEDPIEEKGAILPLSAVAMLAILLVAAFAIDVGAWYSRALDLQRAADVAALGAAQLQGAGGTEAEIQAEVESILEANGFSPPTNISFNVSYPGTNEVAVSITDPDAPLYFGRLVLANVSVSRDATATSGGCLSNCRQPFVVTPPIPALPSDGQGDGFEPLLLSDLSRVYTINHHIDSAALQLARIANGEGESYRDRSLVCVQIPSGSPCAGFPMTPHPTDYSTADLTVLVADEARGQLWYGYKRPFYDDLSLIAGDPATRDLDAITGSTEIGLGCMTIPADPNTASTPCSTPTFVFDTVPEVHVWSYSDRIPRDHRGFSTHPVQHNDRIYVVLEGLRVHCMEMATSTGCAGYPQTIPNSGIESRELVGRPPADYHPSNPAEGGKEPPAIIVGDQLFTGWPTYSAAGSRNEVYCWDLSTASACAGWGDFVSTYWVRARRLFYDIYADGTPRAVCGYGDFFPITCQELNSDTEYMREDLASGLPFRGTESSCHYDRPPPKSERCYGTLLNHGTKLFVGSFNTNTTHCVDLVTNDPCGTINHPGTTADDSVLPYAYVPVPGQEDTCIMGLGHGSEFFTFNPQDMLTCPTGSATIKLYACPCADGTISWGMLSVPAEFLATFTRFEVTVTRPDGSIVAGPVDLIDPATGGRIDLSHVDASTVPIVPPETSRKYLIANISADIAAGYSWDSVPEGEMRVTERSTLID